LQLQGEHRREFLDSRLTEWQALLVGESQSAIGATNEQIRSLQKKKGETRFRYRASNNEIVFSSEGLQTKSFGNEGD
jgi:hypothetical protein